MSTMTATTQFYRVYIRSTPQAVWDAITKPEWTERYGYQSRADFDLRVGGRAHGKPSAAWAGFEGIPETIVDGEFLEVDPPRRLVQTWRMLMDAEMAAEGFTRLTHEIEEIDGGVVKLTVIHELEGAPKLAAMVAGASEAEGAGGGWAWVLSDLKTLLESGSHMAAS
jgi:uncharacterized protein YndB with AHSA1/START domain